MNPDANRDLQHFLRLALAQVRHKIKKAAPTDPTARLRLLEELMKEQVPNENSDSATRTSR